MSPINFVGDSGEVPSDAYFVRSDSQANELVNNAKRAKETLPKLCLLGGDLARTLGAHNNEKRLRANNGTHLQVDLGAVLVDGRLFWFLANLVARNSWWHGPLVIAANAAFIGTHNVAPRAHPGDGLLDIIEGNLGFSQRVKAFRRLRSGSHIPHRDIKVRRSKATQLDLPHPMSITLDGLPHGKATRLSIRVEPAALDVWV